jgi:hypothetical protein
MRWVVAILLFVAACTSVRPYRQVAADARVTTEKKAIIAPFVSAHFPPVYRTVRDTIRLTDTAYNGKLMYELYKTIETLLNAPKTDNPETKRRLDSLIKACSQSVTTTVTIRDTVYIADEAKDMAISQFVSSVQAENAILKTDTKEYKDRSDAAAKRMRTYMLGMYAAIAVAFMLLILLFKR